MSTKATLMTGIVALTMLVCVCPVAQAGTWYDYGPFVGPEANVDIPYCWDVGFALDPITHLPHVAYFYNATGATQGPRTWQVKYSYYDGATWHTTTVRPDLQESSTDPYNYVLYPPHSITLALKPDGAGGVLGGIAYVYWKATKSGDALHQAYSLSSNIQYVPLHNGLAGTRESVMGTVDPDAPVIIWDADGVSPYVYPEPSSTHSISLGFHSNNQPFLAFTCNKGIMIPDHLFDTKGQICYRSKLSGTWEGSQWSSGPDEFDSATVIDQVYGYVDRSFADVSLAMNASLPLGQEPCIAYSVQDRDEAAVRAVRYAHVQPSGTWSTEQVTSGFGTDDVQDYRYTLRVSLALNSSAAPCIAFENGGISYTEWTGSSWSSPQVVYYNSQVLQTGYMTRLGSLDIDPLNNKSTVSIGEYDSGNAMGSSIYVYARSGSTWERIDSLGGTKDYWRPQLRVEPSFGAPTVAATRSFLGIYGWAAECPSVVVTVKDQKSGSAITNATVTLTYLGTPVTPVVTGAGSGVWKYIRLEPHPAYAGDSSYQLQVTAPGHDPYSSSLSAVVRGRCLYQTVQLRPNPYGCAASPHYGASSSWGSSRLALLPITLLGVALAAWFALRKVTRRAH